MTENVKRVFRFLIKECGLSVADYGRLNDAQIKILCTEDKRSDPAGVPH